MRVSVILLALSIGLGLNQHGDRQDVKMSVLEVRPHIGPTFTHKIGQRQTVAEAFMKVGLSALDIHQMVTAAREHYNLNHVRPGLPFLYDSPHRLTLKISPTEHLHLIQKEGTWIADLEEQKTVSEIHTFQGKVESSLWDSAIKANIDPELVVELAELFGWQIDFAREVRKGDLWRISVRKDFVDEQFIGWGDIVAAEYINAGRKYSAVRFERKKGSETELVGYFDKNGESLRKMFLKSPIKFGRISSRFSRRRFHPIRKVYRPHLGVDYAAPRGTPIRAVGDGRVIIRARRGGAGKMIRIRHNSTYESAYMHMSRYARGIKVGSRVKQGDVIGYVGSTGLATGPHLHYEFFVHRKYVDPLSVEFPSADPVPKELISEFEQAAHKRMASLPKWNSQLALLLKSAD